MSVVSAPLIVALAVVALALTSSTANADISRADLARVGVHTPAGAREPLARGFHDQDGRAVTLGGAMGDRTGLLVFQDYRCRTLCGPALAIVAAGIQHSGLKPGRDFRLIAIGLNPRETPSDAASMRASRLGGQPGLEHDSVFLTGDAASIAAVTSAVGFGYAYDPTTDQFTHPVAAFTLEPNGLVTHVLPEVSLTGPELHDAVLGTVHGEVGSLVDTLRLLCHDLVPLTGRYDGVVQSGLRVAGAVTLVVMAALGFVMLRRRAA